MKFVKPEKNFGEKNLQLVIDSNEYIFALGVVRYPNCEKLLAKVAESMEVIPIRITRLIIEEVRSNLTAEAFKEFILFINTATIIDNDFDIPFELGARYEARGLKSADALIAAYVEWTGADVLVTENRHFLSRQANLPFKILTAGQCIKFLNK